MKTDSWIRATSRVVDGKKHQRLGQDVKRLEEVLDSISKAIEVVRFCKCDSAVALLEMAELELRMKVHDISEAELSAFCHELENRVHSRARGQVIALRPKFEKMVRRKST